MAESKSSEKKTDDLPTRPESPTTAGQLDFDDDFPENDTHKTPNKSQTPSKPLTATVEDEAPPPISKTQTSVSKPTQQIPPQDPRSQAEHTLIEAFPTIDIKVIRAVLLASGGQLEPAFNALLAMSDPEFNSEQETHFKPVEHTPPPPPPPSKSPQMNSAQKRQMEQDEMYARQLAQHFQNTDTRQSRPQQQYQQQQQQRQQGLYPGKNGGQYGYHEEGDPKSFLDETADDLAEFGETVRKGFVETQNKVTGWIDTFRKKLEGDEDDPYNGPPRQDPRMPPRKRYDEEDLYSRPVRDGGMGKNTGGGYRSTSGQQYDADPRVLGDDLAGLEIRDEEAPPPKPPRPQANVNLFKPQPAIPPQTGPVDEVEAAFNTRSTPSPSPAPNTGISTPGTGSKKWQPLTTLAAKPIKDDDNDPFSVSDSDEEKDVKNDEVRVEDKKRLESAAQTKTEREDSKVDDQVAKDDDSGETTKKLEASKKGSLDTKDAVAEKLLTS